MLEIILYLLLEIFMPYIIRYLAGIISYLAFGLFIVFSHLGAFVCWVANGFQKPFVRHVYPKKHSYLSPLLGFITLTTSIILIIIIVNR